MTYSHFADIGRGSSVSLPALSSSYQVTGLRLGRQYRFSIQPNFENGLGPESSVDEHTGNPSTHAHLFFKHLLVPELSLQTTLSSVCADGRLDVVFLVPASSDRIRLARPLRDLLTSAARSFHTVGPRDSQVPFLINEL